ncbi:MAG TPA: hypothetical protein VLR88_00345 [Propionibacteriaceae bacterium]|nr:hypothetical protein [Propionibacteriaceae bacterium]
MAHFVIRASSRRPAIDCFDHLADWDAHGAVIPLTTLEHEGPPRVGQRFVARTGLGRLGMGKVGFDDVMVVTELRPPAGDDPGDTPGVGEVQKTGRVVGGHVRWTVTPSTSGSDVEWNQDLTVGWLPGWADPVVGLVGRAAYTAGLRRLLR